MPQTSPLLAVSLCSWTRSRDFVSRACACTHRQLRKEEQPISHGRVCVFTGIFLASTAGSFLSDVFLKKNWVYLLFSFTFPKCIVVWLQHSGQSEKITQDTTDVCFRVLKKATRVCWTATVSVMYPYKLSRVLYFNNLSRNSCTGGITDVIAGKT